MSGNSKESSSLDSFNALHDKALQAFKAGRLVDADALCHSAIECIPDDVGVLNLLGQINLGIDPLVALRWFSKAIALSPTLPNLYFNLSLAHQASGRLDLAIESIRKALELDPTVPVLHAKLGHLLCLASAWQEAVIVLRHALKLDSMSIPIRLNLAQALTDLGQIDEAEAIARAALFLNPKEANVHRMLGRVHQLNGKFDEAANCFKAAIKLQPKLAPAYFALAYSKRIESEDRDLMEDMEALIQDAAVPRTDLALLHYGVGKGADDLGEYDLASKHFQLANEIAFNSLVGHGGRYDEMAELEKVSALISNAPTFESLAPVAESSFSDRPIFVVGMIRSGTTLVEQILTRHPEIESAGELPYWIKAMHSGQNVESHVLGYEAELDRVSISADRIVDKMPLNYQALDTVLRAYPNARIIHCRRHPLDTCLSIFTTPFRQAPNFGHSLDNIALAYRQYLRLMEHWRSILPVSTFLEVDYESLVSDPELNIRQMIQFVDLDWNDRCLGAEFNRRPVNTPSLWQVRQPIYRKSINRWHNYAVLLAPIKNSLNLDSSL